jgi:hypothetical protein
VEESGKAQSAVARRYIMIRRVESEEFEAKGK